MDGRTVPSWFDCVSFDHATRTEDETGLHAAASRMHALISKEISDHGIPSERIVIGGLSQGGATSILTMLTSEKQLGGLFALSTYIPLRKKVPEFATPCAKATPILWSHGNADLQVNYDEWKGFARTLAEQLGIPFRLTESVDVLKKDQFIQNGVQLEFHRYDDLGHFIDETELKNLGLWVSLRVPGV
ncbi:hypothetical protein GALMADRAFT_138326 [Galerina marginata CBS 339.88]|uniref:Acyl-protein thioesterase 1 n=1 Tax=Galerina marginata (strain CBS 339.88) TaxID=685588 RepID=A0A067T4T1_GALM3|nr:hypothetical protein GALMADRAFT_138326 [Galerina marginata CBS 339.88]